MPELPEVETTRRGIEPHLLGHRIARLTVHNPHLRWPVPVGLENLVAGQSIHTVSRRGKYLLLELDTGTLLIHLGMSGSLRMTQPNDPLLKHDHIELVLDSGKQLRYCDPRRFGSWLWTNQPPAAHPLLAQLGPEPLGRDFTARYLFNSLQGRKQAIKTLIMDSHLVVGVGNIYANEALFMAGIHPQRQGSMLDIGDCTRLVRQIKTVLKNAIHRGGTTLRDFVGGDGKAGYFAQELLVYGRANQPCKTCQSPLQEIRLGQRSTIFCLRCQS